MEGEETVIESVATSADWFPIISSGAKGEREREQRIPFPGFHCQAAAVRFPLIIYGERVCRRNKARQTKKNLPRRQREWGLYIYRYI